MMCLYRSINKLSQRALVPRRSLYDNHDDDDFEDDDDDGDDDDNEDDDDSDDNFDATVRLAVVTGGPATSAFF